MYNIICVSPGVFVFLMDAGPRGVIVWCYSQPAFIDLILTHIICIRGFSFFPPSYPHNCSNGLRARTRFIHP